jgi:hypothetical protein
MEHTTKGTKKLNQIEIEYGMFLLPESLRSEYTRVAHNIIVVDDRTHTPRLCVTQYHRVNGLSKIYDYYHLKEGDVIEYVLDFDNKTLHITCLRKGLFGFKKRKEERQRSI